MRMGIIITVYIIRRKREEKIWLFSSSKCKVGAREGSHSDEGQETGTHFFSSCSLSRLRLVLDFAVCPSCCPNNLIFFFFFISFLGIRVTRSDTLHLHPSIPSLLNHYQHHHRYHRSYNTTTSPPLPIRLTSLPPWNFSLSPSPFLPPSLPSISCSRRLFSFLHSYPREPPFHLLSCSLNLSNSFNFHFAVIRVQQRITKTPHFSPVS